MNLSELIRGRDIEQILPLFVSLELGKIFTHKPLAEEMAEILYRHFIDTSIDRIPVSWELVAAINSTFGVSGGEMYVQHLFPLLFDTKDIRNILSRNRGSVADAVSELSTFLTEGFAVAEIGCILNTELLTREGTNVAYEPLHTLLLIIENKYIAPTTIAKNYMSSTPTRLPASLLPPVDGDWVYLEELELDDRALQLIDEYRKYVRPYMHLEITNLKDNHGMDLLVLFNVWGAIQHLKRDGVDPATMLKKLSRYQNLQADGEMKYWNKARISDLLTTSRSSRRGRIEELGYHRPRCHTDYWYPGNLDEIVITGRRGDIFESLTVEDVMNLLPTKNQQITYGGLNRLEVLDNFWDNFYKSIGAYSSSKANRESSQDHLLRISQDKDPRSSHNQEGENSHKQVEGNRGKQEGNQHKQEGGNLQNRSKQDELHSLEEGNQGNQEELHKQDRESSSSKYLGDLTLFFSRKYLENRQSSEVRLKRLIYQYNDQSLEEIGEYLNPELVKKVQQVYGTKEEAMNHLRMRLVHTDQFIEVNRGIARYTEYIDFTIKNFGLGLSKHKVLKQIQEDSRKGSLLPLAGSRVIDTYRHDCNNPNVDCIEKTENKMKYIICPSRKSIIEDIESVIGIPRFYSKGEVTGYVFGILYERVKNMQGEFITRIMTSEEIMQYGGVLVTNSTDLNEFLRRAGVDLNSFYTRIDGYNSSTEYGIVGVKEILQVLFSEDSFRDSKDSSEILENWFSGNSTMTGMSDCTIRVLDS